ncbi:hypothetical protein LNP41_05535, partial [Acinetobacter baumannii]|nr:hypothetical protein [Acinetobacter baumannii]MCC8296011.1 hypothetical protein [Acinetobacter baumannii]
SSLENNYYDIISMSYLFLSCTELSMLSGIVFFTHQVGSFFGGWLGGVNHDLTGNYNVIWLCSIALSILGVIVHFFVNEEAVIHDA